MSECMWFAVAFQVWWFYTNYPGISDITQTCLCSSILCCKMIIFKWFFLDNSLNVAQNCENTLEPPEGGGLNEYTQSILTYRNNPSYISIGILICLSVRSNTDLIRIKLRLFQAHLMCSRNRVLTYSWTSWISCYGDVNVKVGTAISSWIMKQF